MFQMHKRFETPSSHSSFRLLGVCFVCVFVLCYTTTRTIFQILHFLISGETAHIAWCFVISGETAHIAWCFLISGETAHIAWCFVISGETAHIAWCFVISGETAHIAWCFVISGETAHIAWCFVISGETAHIAWCFVISGETAHIAWCFVINGDNCTHCLVSYYIFLPSLFMNNLMHESMTFLDNLYFMISHSIYSNFSQCSRKMKKYGTNDLVLPKYAVNNRVNAQSIICTYKENRWFAGA